MSELIPEPPDQAHVLLGEAPLQVLLVRDDGAAAVNREVDLELPDDFRWWTLDSEGQDPLPWSLVVADDPDEMQDGLPRGLNRTVVQRLYTQAELDQAVADGGYEQVGEHRIALGAGRCVTHGETYEPLELERLRQREGGAPC